MAIPYRAIYKTVQLVTGLKKRWYASSFARGRCDLNRLSQSIGKSSTMSPADVHGVIYALIEASIAELKEGQIVDLGDFGSLQVKIRSKGADTEAAVNKQLIRSSELMFTPGKPFKEMLTQLEYEKH